MQNQHTNEETQGHPTACCRQEHNVMLSLNNIGMRMITLFKKRNTAKLNAEELPQT